MSSDRPEPSACPGQLPPSGHEESGEMAASQHSGVTSGTARDSPETEAYRHSPKDKKGSGDKVQLNKCSCALD